MDSSSWISKEVEAIDVEEFANTCRIRNGDKGKVKKIICEDGITFVTVDFYGKGLVEFLNWRLKIVEKKTLNKSCPRCSGSLVSKETYDPFTNKKYVIDKCISCGWC